MNNKILTMIAAIAVVFAGVAVYAAVADEADADTALPAPEAISVNVTDTNKGEVKFTVSFTGPQTATDIGNVLTWAQWTTQNVEGVGSDLNASSNLTSSPAIGTLAFTALKITNPVAGKSLYTTEFAVNATDIAQTSTVKLAAKITSTLDSGNAVVQYKLFTVTLTDMIHLPAADLKYVNALSPAAPQSLSTFSVDERAEIALQLSATGITGGKWYAEGLPKGMTMGSSGLISGYAHDAATSYPIYVTVYDETSKTAKGGSFTLTISSSQQAKIVLTVDTLTIDGAPATGDTTVSYGGSTIPKYVMKTGTVLSFNIAANAIPGTETVHVLWEHKSATTEVQEVATLQNGTTTDTISLTPAGAGEYVLKAVLEGGATTNNVMYVMDVVVISEVNYAKAGIQFDLTSVAKS